MSRKKPEKTVMLVEEEVDLQALCDEWTSRLRLQDWDITLSWVRFQNIGDFGRTQVSLAMKSAEIQISEPDTLPDDPLTCMDVEVTLVHELLHVSSQPLISSLGLTEQISGGKSPFLEAFIEQTAQALVAAKRGLIRIPRDNNGSE